ncbi:DUF2310 family Zn-ribbon-containing protein [Catalinimonas niigatensis]|uniref:DUF2310 family Zn-ribbon-containing protein n=1 Tax=Catalinimonas niigatensis TaxID=1397264 RepID=UPI00266705D4|nr:DUF2310 family Zn-ribbon-containing protein [Catalinimonas niigatensis]WPP52416.1 DUF2310 family Zn-ribbon-containing protein [Catalinimonas niigatensis]
MKKKLFDACRSGLTILTEKMHIIKLNMRGPKVGTDEFFDYADYYLQSLYGSKQIINQEWQYESIHGGLSLNLFCPEEDAFEEKNATIYVKRARIRLEDELGCSLEFIYQEIDPELGESVIPQNSEFLILKTARVSPLIDGHSLGQIPLYKIPFTYKESYQNINSWEYAYEDVYGLWLIGSVGEKWAQQQMQNHDSGLSKHGIECCKQIEAVTDIPTYYFLFNYRAWGRNRDRERKCPSCSREWYMEGKTFNDFYAFKCDYCRLISELSSSK